MRLAPKGCLGIALLASLSALPAAAQDFRAAEEQVEDIVVTAEELNVVNRPPVDAVVQLNRRVSLQAREFIDCAGAPALRHLRGIVDAQPASSATILALDSHIRRNRPCYHTSSTTLPHPVPFYGRCNPIADLTGSIAAPPPDGGSSNRIFNASIENQICRAVHDRGAIFEDVLHPYAPDLSLSRADTLVPEALARFTANERENGTLRRQQQRRLYLFAACVVQLQPGAAILLTRTEPGSAAENRLASLMIARSQPCRGRAETVTIDTSQFRANSAEALYRWTLAVRNVDSLLPPED